MVVPPGLASMIADPIRHAEIVDRAGIARRQQDRDIRTRAVGRGRGGQDRQGGLGRGQHRRVLVRNVIGTVVFYPSGRVQIVDARQNPSR